MPELPEVETVLRGLKPVLIQKKVSDVIVRCNKLRWPITANLKSILMRQQVLALARRGKYLLIHLTKGTLIIHLGMSGRLCVLTNALPLKPHDHVDVVFSDQLLLRYNDPRRFGAILWTDDDPYQHVLLKKLGPEPFDSAFTAKYLFEKTTSRRVAIKALIMNHHIVVGVGNIYAAEVLFLAGIHPATLANQISLEQCQLLVKFIKQVLKKAIEQGGTTLKDFVNSEGKPGYFSQKLKVYGREGQSCVRCQTPLQSMILGQRASAFCPVCQKSPKIP
ncbi:MAG: bifunctional DNA-formamidopyrimidine glycosylase/DNA-(apurinic or apyrimidinic site) lyase [Gammaproteobacteria bacterium]|nr:bifunctional DNA-formamidopyrimidine glycosylase/DNA-(apurinic or apyrimidinic site) lyase [Gammaproteobacteria bacterium]